jgi:hypothetical protein
MANRRRDEYLCLRRKIKSSDIPGLYYLGIPLGRDYPQGFQFSLSGIG